MDGVEPVQATSGIPLLQTSDLTKDFRGFRAVDGISLTVVDPAGDDFSVAIIPHTEEATTLGLKGIGDPVNLETDIIARQVAVYLENMK